MGTRNLTLIWYKGRWRIAQYGQWDGYPSGQGQRILLFLSHPENLVKLAASLDKDVVIEVSEEEVDKMYETSHELPDSLSRDTGANILALIADASAPIPVQLQLDFFFDELFCEWAYVLDLGERRLEVYSGQHERMSDAPLNPKIDQLADQYGQTPLPLVGCHSFDSLPVADGLVLSRGQNEPPERDTYSVDDADGVGDDDEDERNTEKALNQEVD